MSLVTAFVECGERTYGINWTAMQRSVSQRLALAPGESAVLDPWQHPTYWCVPILVGSYLGSSTAAVHRDTADFLSGCAIRHLMFKRARSIGARVGESGDSEVFRAIAAAYKGCQIGAPAAFEAQFSAKCQPWMILLGIGTRSIAAEVGDQHPDFQAAMTAIVLVYSLLQLVDDWHDRDDDHNREHWNMWADATAVEPLTVVEPLLRGSRAAAVRLRPHLLRRALASQLHDTAEELSEIVTQVGAHG